MSLLQILFIAGCGLFGYVAVSRVLSELQGKRHEPPARKEPPEVSPPLTDFECPASGWAPGSHANAPWHQVLGLAPDADMASIMQAYSRLINQYRSDASSTQATDVRQLCEQRLHQIEQAYQQALQRFR